MVSGPVVPLLLFGLLSCARTAAGSESYLLTAPQPEVVEIGTNFTATCVIVNTSEVTADDLYWNVSQKTIPKEQYTKVNSTALNVTLPITGEKAEWLFCLCREVSFNVVLNQGRCMHGIYLRKGYPPRLPVNLSCIALQNSTLISPTITCSWETVGLQTKEFATKYRLVLIRQSSSPPQEPQVWTEGNSASVTLDIFPHYVDVEVWVEAKNKLGTVVSEHLKKQADSFAKTNPPYNIQVMSEKSFPTSLLMNWIRPIDKHYVALIYEIRFCQNGSHVWTYVPLVDTSKDIESFRLQNLQPDTVYITQVRCKHKTEGFGYWSEWSTNSTKRTPEDRPGKPELWQIITEGKDSNERSVQFICKDPLFPNGRILSFEIKIQDHKAKVQNGSVEWESIPVNRSGQRTVTALKTITLSSKRAVKVHVRAVNSVGRSPAASLFIPEMTNGQSPVKELRVWPHEGQLWLEWKPPTGTPVTEYVVEWATDDVIDWQRETASTRQTAIRGDVEKFVCYTVSVYPIYSGWTGRPTSTQAFLEQRAPLEGPTVRLNGQPRHNEAVLEWNVIPSDRRQGFITNYTIFYTSGEEILSVTVTANTTSYTLTSLSSNTKYDTWVSASTIRGSTNGFKHSFTTLKYAPGQIEFIVVGVSLSFLFVVVMTMLLCIYKKDVIKRNFWPQIPDPGESTIGNWSPDYPLKAETPKENCLSGISVLDVDVGEGKCVFEEDKASLPLKKDKYLSEEHSSGIGGSSCMSSPRQSVSDSDEGGDVADTTASTVQYSSVVASNGYKGQTPSSQAQQAIFSRSESTQPLLESEENPDMMVQEGSRQSQRFLQQPCSTAGKRADSNQLLEMEPQEVLEPLEFCSLEEDPEQTPTEERPADWLSAGPVSSYMPQRGGYRPQ